MFSCTVGFCLGQSFSTKDCLGVFITRLKFFLNYTKLIKLAIQVHIGKSKIILVKQESIPVGCVPSSAVAVGLVCFLLPGRGVCPGVSSQRRAECLPRGVSGQGDGGCLPDNPLPPCEQNDRQV